MAPLRKAGGGQRQPFGKTDTSYYPDLVEGGGLLPVLRAAAAAGDYDVGTIDIQYASQFAGMTDALIDTGKGRILVGIAADRRLFFADIWNGRLEMASGGMPEPSDVLAVAAAWRSGISYDELEARFRSIHVKPLARVLAAPDPVTAMWDWLLGDETFAGERPLLEAIHQHPVLRSFFPDFQWHGLALSRKHDLQEGSELTGDEDVMIWHAGPGGWAVERRGARPARAECASLDEALAETARLLTEEPVGK